MTVNLIEIPQAVPGFNKFIGSWLCPGPKNILVDVGPAATAARLIDALEAQGIGHIDHILITHIHIDHAGALADLLARFPMANAICHEKAMPLLADPSKLWAGSLSVLRETAQMYGEPKPVPEDRLIPHNCCSIPDLMVLETPGHAAHHLSFSYEDRLFIGEAGGNFMAIGDETYLRPATPPRFFMEAYLGSLKRLLGLKNQTVCYGHFGEAPNSHEMLERFRDQLLRWKEIVSARLIKGEANPVPGCMEALLENDPELRLFDKMASDIQDRERFFLTNSIKGFIGFLREKQ